MLIQGGQTHAAGLEGVPPEDDIVVAHDRVVVDQGIVFRYRLPELFPNACRPSAIGMNAPARQPLF